MMKMKIMLAASILCAMTTTCAGAADMTDNMGNMAGFPPISSIGKKERKKETMRK